MKILQKFQILASLVTSLAASLAISLALASCASQAPPAAPPPPVTAACNGAVMTPPPGLRPATDAALLASAVGAPGKGGLCTGQVFVVERPVTVYRVWDSRYPASQLGSWWSFDRPEGPRASYRHEEDICRSWSSLNKMTSCALKPGTKLVLGPGQSAACPAGYTIPASPANQIYLARNAAGQQVSVDDCSPAIDWPQAAK